MKRLVASLILGLVLWVQTACAQTTEVYEYGSFLMTTGSLTSCDGVEHKVSWVNNYGLEFRVDRSELWIGGPFGALEDLYAVAQIRETGNVMNVDSLDRYSDVVSSKQHEMTYAHPILIEPGQHVDLLYYCLYLGGPGYLGHITKGIGVNFYIWTH